MHHATKQTLPTTIVFDQTFYVLKKLNESNNAGAEHLSCIKSITEKVTSYVVCLAPTFRIKCVTLIKGSTRIFGWILIYSIKTGKKSVICFIAISVNKEHRFKITKTNRLFPHVILTPSKNSKYSFHNCNFFACSNQFAVCNLFNLEYVRTQRQELLTPISSLLFWW